MAESVLSCLENYMPNSGGFAASWFGKNVAPDYAFSISFSTSTFGYLNQTIMFFSRYVVIALT